MLAHHDEGPSLGSNDLFSGVRLVAKSFRRCAKPNLWLLNSLMFRVHPNRSREGMGNFSTCQDPLGQGFGKATNGS